MSIVVLYHADCQDGYGAAWAAYKLFGDEAEYVPVNAGDHDGALELLKDMVPESDGKALYMVDFALFPDQLDVAAEMFDKVAIIDHHETAIGWYSDYDGAENVELVLDKNHSGAVLSWKYFHREKEIPRLLQYIEDRDLWRWELPDSEIVLLALDAYPYSFGNLDRLVNDIERLKTEGAVLFKYRNGMLKLQLQNQHCFLFELEGTPYSVPAVNCSLRALTSESCHELIKEHPEAPFVVAYRRQADGTWAYSLRSQGNFDVADFAARYAGGGGHVNAAGMTTDTLPTFIPKNFSSSDVVKEIS